MSAGEAGTHPASLKNSCKGATAAWHIIDADSLEQVVETASGLAPEEEAQFMQQRSAAASATVSDAFKAEVRRGVRRQTVGARLVYTQGACR